MKSPCQKCRLLFFRRVSSCVDGSAIRSARLRRPDSRLRNRTKRPPSSALGTFVDLRVVYQLRENRVEEDLELVDEWHGEPELRTRLSTHQIVAPRGCSKIGRSPSCSEAAPCLGG